MKKHAQWVTLSIIAAASILFGMVLAGGVKLTPASLADPEIQPASLRTAPSPQSPTGEAARVPIPTFADIVERANPAVVGITSTELVQGGQRSAPFHSPFEFFFGPDQRRRMPQRDEPRREDSGGSGFLISDDGYILTNNHVIENADRIRVTLSEDDTEYQAEVVGTDASTDLALLKITTDRKLPFIPMGDSDTLRVGDWVIAVGNPYFYEHTVTVGVVSSKGRKLYDLSKDPSLDDFIQTDAAINFGNSGGPLLNISGEVVGVNSAISAVGQGIGFAVPVNIAKQILPQLKASGHVSRGYLGIRLAAVTSDFKEVLGLKSTKGALVQDVERGLPGDKAGILPGDVIVAVEGKTVESTDELVRLISNKEPGSRVRLTLIRDGRQLVVTARLSDRSEFMNARREGPPGPQESPEVQGIRRLGITVDNLTGDLRRQLDVEEGVSGVVVTEVSQTSEAYEQAITRGDLITSVNKAPVSSVAEYRREMSKVRPGSKVLLRVYDPQRKAARFVVLDAVEEE
jgi:serine protease Do